MAVNLGNFKKNYTKKKIISNNIIENNELNHCWINLFAMEACQYREDEYGRPTKKERIREEVLNLQQDLLYELLKLLEPKVIIFLTGNSLDYVIEKSLGIAPNAMKKVQIIDLLEIRQACRIVPEENSIFNQSLIIRLYNPTYFMAYINGFNELRKKLKDAGCKIINAQFYTETIISYLKKHIAN